MALRIRTMLRLTPQTPHLVRLWRPRSLSTPAGVTIRLGDVVVSHELPKQPQLVPTGYRDAVFPLESQEAGYGMNQLAAIPSGPAGNPYPCCGRGSDS